MSRDFRPYVGCRLMGSWPLDEPLPAGWHRDDPACGEDGAGALAGAVAGECMTEPECPLSELPPSQCACPKHRGGAAPGEEPIETVGQPFEAAYGGLCVRTWDAIKVGDLIARVADGDGYVHVPGCPR